MSRPAWMRRVFDADSRLRPEARIRRQVDAIERFLGLKFRNRVLDIGCGAGSQTLELARRRYRIVGMDGAAEGLTGARAQARVEKLTVHFVVDDMRRVPYEGEFNAVLNLRNPIGTYPSERDDLDCLKATQRALKPAGKLLLDLLNREWLIRRLRAAQDPHFDLATSRIDCRGFTPRGGRPGYMADTMRVYSLSEVARMLQESGFAFRRAWGGYDGKPYWVDSPRMIVMAEKLPQTQAVRRHYDDGLPRAIRIKGRAR